MRSFCLIIFLLFITVSFQRLAQIDSLYAQFNNARSSVCLNAITIAADLETTAQTNANSLCTGGTSNINNYLYYYYSTSNPFTNNDLYNYALGIYSRSKGNWTCSTDTSKNNNPGEIQWQRFVVNPTQEVGCAFNNNGCTNKYIFVCTFRNFPFTSPIVPVANCNCGTKPTTKAPVATTKATTAPVATTKATTAPVATTKATTKATTAPVATTKPTTVATTNPSTGDQIKDAFLVPINNARSCMGVQALLWNDTLAASAKAWADFSAKTCNSAHAYSSSPIPRIESDQGENIWAFQATSLTAVQAIGLGVEFWNKEAVGFVCSSNQCTLTSSPQSVTLSNGFSSYLSSCGHYTQNIWKKTTSIGCAYAQCPGVSPNKFLGVCRYNPPGNWNGEHPLTGTANCGLAPGCGAKRSLAITSNNQNTQNAPTTTKSTSFFESDSQVAVFVMAIAILVVVVAIFVVILISSRKRSDDYQLMETN